MGGGTTALPGNQMMNNNAVYNTDQDRNQLQAAQSGLADIATNGSPLAQAQLQAATNQNIANATGVIASAKGINPAMAARQAGYNAANTGQAAANQSAQLQAQTSMQAMGQFGQNALNQGQLDLNQSTSQNQLVAGISQANNASTNAMTQNVVKGMGTAASMMANGGIVADTSSGTVGTPTQGANTGAFAPGAAQNMAMQQQMGLQATGDAITGGTNGTGSVNYGTTNMSAGLSASHAAAANNYFQSLNTKGGSAPNSQAGITAMQSLNNPVTGNLIAGAASLAGIGAALYSKKLKAAKADAAKADAESDTESDPESNEDPGEGDTSLSENDVYGDNSSEDNNPEADASDASAPPMEAKGGLIAEFAKGGRAKAKSKKVPALVSPGETYLRPQQVKAVAKGKANPLKIGERIPGKPKVMGNSYANDTVPKTLEKGGVVIPNSVMQSSDPAHNAYKFVQAVMAKQKARGKKK